ncbi:hypothetical protein SEMRO_1657_G289100.1 [Seminavis robusta]|uniref:Uncharacterized protein n=1 Tax=Seminavis robusta TaxID=568900 RepID=A0A9N8EUG8_9STRA|nr:hypothetical protein SEMRO_1657_G289090.1 [Seminavis robusta]CAB9525300.1 hypothetical protein SEMRO_1657_G289100.1 [Seminavis robusta]|eukprot:Sro1657_g289090.1 n/a (369) ;mRNA; r:8411-9517
MENKNRVPSENGAYEAAANGMLDSNQAARGDGRMNRAVAFKLEDPHLSLEMALRMGGFQYPTDATAKTVDGEGITLRQRKNQLIRRVRKANKLEGVAGSQKSSPGSTHPKQAAKPNAASATGGSSSLSFPASACFSSFSTISTNHDLYQNTNIFASRPVNHPFHHATGTLHQNSQLDTASGTQAAKCNESRDPPINSCSTSSNKAQRTQSLLKCDEDCIEQDAKPTAVSSQGSSSLSQHTSASFSPFPDVVPKNREVYHHVSASLPGSHGPMHHNVNQATLQHDSRVGATHEVNSFNLDDYESQDPRVKLGLTIFSEELHSSVYPRAMQMAGFSEEEARETSSKFHQFASVAWARESERLLGILNDHS